MPEAAPSPAPQRLLSLDALRGFDMFWILGFGGLLESLAQRYFPEAPMGKLILTQLDHVEWEGFHFEDLIFPLFLFIAGVSMALALPKRVARDGKCRTVGHLILRALVIFIVGVIYSGGLSHGKPQDSWMDVLHQVRWLGVLQRIGVASAAAGMLSLFLRSRGLLIAAATLLIGYFLMLKFIPVPGFGAGDFAEGHNLADYLDKLWLPGRPYKGLDHDPEGILSTLPAIATALLGMVAGRGLSSPASLGRKVGELLLVGAAMVALGWLWAPWFPVIKKIWTSSFVLVAGGWSAILLGLFYWVIDGIKTRQPIVRPFVWVGANPIFLYLVSGLEFFREIAHRIVGHPQGEWAWVVSLTTFLLMLLTARWLYKNRVYIRI